MATTAHLPQRPVKTSTDDVSAGTSGACEACADAGIPSPVATRERWSRRIDDVASGSTGLIRDGILTVALDEEAPRGVRVLDYSVTQADGRAMPAWLGRPSIDILEGCLPTDQRALELWVRAVLSNGKIIERELRIDLETGAIEHRQWRLRPRHVPLFSEQIRKFAYLSDTGANAIAAALEPSLENPSVP